MLPLSTKGRVNKAAIPLLHAHSDVVTDLCFSPFDDGLLATGSQDLTVRDRLHYHKNGSLSLNFVSDQAMAHTGVWLRSGSHRSLSRVGPAGAASQGGVSGLQSFCGLHTLFVLRRGFKCLGPRGGQGGLYFLPRSRRRDPLAGVEQERQSAGHAVQGQAAQDRRSQAAERCHLLRFPPGNLVAPVSTLEHQTSFAFIPN